MQPNPPGRPLEPQALAQILEYLRQNRAIAAIKTYRTATGAGLADSKHAVDAIRETHGIGRATTAQTANSGAVLIVVIVVIVAIAIVAGIHALQPR